MSTNNTNEWAKLWNDYANSLEIWRKLFDEILKVNSDMQQKFNAVMKKAYEESSTDTMKQFGENWQKAVNDAGLKSIKGFDESWQKATSQPDNGFKQFVEYWQKSMSDEGLDQMKAYGDMMKKFAETWNSMWPQK